MRHQAVSNLYPNVHNQVGDKAFDVEGNPVDIDETKVAEKINELQSEYDSTQYQRDRIYPPIGDQLDALYHAGVFPKEMADKLKAVKASHPKPE